MTKVKTISNNINNVNTRVGRSDEDIEFKKKVVERYDSSFVYSFNSLAAVFKRTPQRLQKIHADFPHDCTRRVEKESRGK